MAAFINHITLQTAVALDKFLDQPWPPRHINRDAYDLRLQALKDLIGREGGQSSETAMGFSVSIGGVRSTSTSSLSGATRNWITAVRKKAAAQVSA
jgi:hypothetical protein